VIGIVLEEPARSLKGDWVIEQSLGCFHSFLIACRRLEEIHAVLPS
jgi:hypothetical protein